MFRVSHKINNQMSEIERNSFKLGFLVGILHQKLNPKGYTVCEGLNLRQFISEINYEISSCGVDYRSMTIEVIGDIMSIYCSDQVQVSKLYGDLYHLRINYREEIHFKLTSKWNECIQICEKKKVIRYDDEEI